MKGLFKAIVVLGLLGGIGYLVYNYAFRSSEARACAKIVALCGSQKAVAAKCEQAFEKLEKVAGKESLSKSLDCLQKADSCPRAWGCVAGGVGAGVVGEFIKGVSDALKKQ
jgi:hypothetical protein